MKKQLSSCAECGEDNSILTQISSTVEIIFLCSDCYNLKYLKEGQSEISYVEKENFFIPCSLVPLKIFFAIIFCHI